MHGRRSRCPFGAAGYCGGTAGYCGGTAGMERAGRVRELPPGPGLAVQVRPVGPVLRRDAGKLYSEVGTVPADGWADHDCSIRTRTSHAAS